MYDIIHFREETLRPMPADEVGLLGVLAMDK